MSDDGPKTHRATCGVPQESIRGSLLWIIMYDDILRLQLSKGVTVINFADNIRVTVVAQDINRIEILTKRVMS